MTFSQENRNYNHVSTIRARPITLPSSARRRAPTPAFHPTTLCLIVTIASTQFIIYFKKSEATSNTTTHPSIFILAYLSFLLSMLGALSGALSSGPAPRIRNQDMSAFVESPARPASAYNPFLPDMIFQLSPSRRLIQKIWDFPSICAFASLMCFAAQVWLYVCIYEPCSVQVVGGFAAAATLVALRRLRTSPRFVPSMGEQS